MLRKSILTGDCSKIITEKLEFYEKSSINIDLRSTPFTYRSFTTFVFGRNKKSLFFIIDFSIFRQFVEEVVTGLHLLEEKEIEERR